MKIRTLACRQVGVIALFLASLATQTCAESAPDFNSCGGPEGKFDLKFWVMMLEGCLISKAEEFEPSGAGVQEVSAAALTACEKYRAKLVAYIDCESKTVGVGEGVVTNTEPGFLRTAAKAIIEQRAKKVRAGARMKGRN